MQLPTREQCLEYFNQYKVPQNIKEHCLKVEQVATFLAKKLKEAGEEINVELISCLALLHDLFKVVVLESLGTNKHHQFQPTEEEIAMWKKLRAKYPGKYEGDVAYDIFKDDFPELALSIQKVGIPKRKDKSYEEMLVHYADWRIFRNEIVLLRDRLTRLRENYPKEAEDWRIDEEIILEFENKIMKVLNMRPKELQENVK